MDAAMTTIDQRLTHRIVVDAGQWAKGATESEALEQFRKTHSKRKLRDHQIWAVTPETTVNELGRFVAPRDGYVPPVRIN